MRKTVLLTALLLSAPLPALAQLRLAPHYEYIEAGWLKSEPDAANDESGGFIGGQFQIGEMFHVFGEYADAGPLTIWEAGGGWHGLFGERLDLVAQASVVDFEIEDGIKVSGGLRWLITQRLEVNGFLSYYDYGSESDSTVEANVVWNFFRSFALGGGYESGDEFDWVRLYARFNFGRR